MNPKEQCKAITLRSGKGYDGQIADQNEESRGQDQRAPEKQQAAKEAEKKKTTEDL